MYIRYKNEIFRFIDKGEYFKIITLDKRKATDKFYKNIDDYVKKISINDADIQAIFDVDFVLTYIDTSETRWNVNEGKTMHKSPVIKKDEVGLTLSRDS